MDRRIEKTRKAILDAFYTLITKMEYSKISIQKIIDEANIGRSTFYQHFETKDDLLKSMCTDLFEHIFKHDVHKHCCEMVVFDNTFKEKITHILNHLLDNRKVLRGILASESEKIFFQYFRKYLDEIVLTIKFKECDVPINFLQNHISGSFIELIKYWVKNNFKETPSTLTNYYLKMLPKEL